MRDSIHFNGCGALLSVERVYKRTTAPSRYDVFAFTLKMDSANSNVTSRGHAIEEVTIQVYRLQLPELIAWLKELAVC